MRRRKLRRIADEHFNRCQPKMLLTVYPEVDLSCPFIMYFISNKNHNDKQCFGICYSAIYSNDKMSQSTDKKCFIETYPN